MIPSAARASLLNAVPSFGPAWEEWLADQADYVRFPDAALTEPEVGHEFLSRLAWHLGKRVAAGEAHEAGWIFAALKPMLEAADEATWNALTVGFLESLIHAVEREGGDAAVLAGCAAGPQTSAAWRAAFEYIHPPDEHAPEPREP